MIILIKWLLNCLWKGFQSSFCIAAVGVWVATWTRNLESIQGHKTVVSTTISKEASEGRTLGPFTAPPVRYLKVSPLGIIPKKVPGEFRLIHHLSFPSGDSFNNRIPQELCSMCYTSLM